jgi:hypothetical protein
MVETKTVTTQLTKRDLTTFQKLLDKASNEQLRDLDTLVYSKGLERGFGQYWNEHRRRRAECWNE